MAPKKAAPAQKTPRKRTRREASVTSVAPPEENEEDTSEDDEESGRFPENQTRFSTRFAKILSNASLQEDGKRLAVVGLLAEADEMQREAIALRDREAGATEALEEKLAETEVNLRNTLRELEEARSRHGTELAGLRAALQTAQRKGESGGPKQDERRGFSDWAVKQLFDELATCVIPSSDEAATVFLKTKAMKLMTDHLGHDTVFTHQYAALKPRATQVMITYPDAMNRLRRRLCGPDRKSSDESFVIESLEFEAFSELLALCLVRAAGETGTFSVGSWLFCCRNLLRNGTEHFARGLSKKEIASHGSDDRHAVTSELERTGLDTMLDRTTSIQDTRALARDTPSFNLANLGSFGTWKSDTSGGPGESGRRNAASVATPPRVIQQTCAACGGGGHVSTVCPKPDPAWYRLCQSSLDRLTLLRKGFFKLNASMKEKLLRELGI